MKVSEMFPSRYVTGADLGGRAFTVTIQTIQAERMRPGPGKPEETKYVLYTIEGKKGIILSRTLAGQIAEVTGSDDTDSWEGCKITIYGLPMSVGGQARIAIRAKAPQPVTAGQNGNGSAPQAEGQT